MLDKSYLVSVYTSLYNTPQLPQLHHIMKNFYLTSCHGQATSIFDDFDDSVQAVPSNISPRDSWTGKPQNTLTIEPAVSSNFKS